MCFKNLNIKSLNTHYSTQVSGDQMLWSWNYASVRQTPCAIVIIQPNAMYVYSKEVPQARILLHKQFCLSAVLSVTLPYIQQLHKQLHTWLCSKPCNRWQARGNPTCVIGTCVVFPNRTLANVFNEIYSQVDVYKTASLVWIQISIPRSTILIFALILWHMNHATICYLNAAT